MNEKIPWRFAEACVFFIRIWVTPKDVDELVLDRELDESVYHRIVVQCPCSPGYSSVDAKEFVVYDAHNRETLEDIAHFIPNAEITVLPEHLRVESKSLCHCEAVVVPSQEENACWIQHFKSEKQENCLNAHCPSVDVVSKKEVCRVGTLSSNSEYF